MTSIETRNPGLMVNDAVEHILSLAQTWLGWDGRPRVADDRERLYTPNKAIRRHTDHFIDHLAEIEAMLAGEPSIPDEFLASFVTLGSDWAPFTEAELNEARQRLRRLAQLYVRRLEAAGPSEWDREHEGHWTIRRIVEHVSKAWYADQVGDLSRA